MIVVPPLILPLARWHERLCLNECYTGKEVHIRTRIARVYLTQTSTRCLETVIILDEQSDTRGLIVIDGIECTTYFHPVDELWILQSHPPQEVVEYFT